MSVNRICRADFSETNALKGLSTNTDDIAVHEGTIAYSGSLNAGISPVGFGEINGVAGGKRSVQVSAKAMRVISMDEGQSDIILHNIGPRCKALIRHHLADKRTVFIAAAAVQAEEYQISQNVDLNGKVNVKCKAWHPCRLFLPSVDGSVDYGHSTTLKSPPNTYVTIGLVPSEIGERKSIESADVDKSQPSNVSETEGDKLVNPLALNIDQ